MEEKMLIDGVITVNVIDWSVSIDRIEIGENRYWIFDLNSAF